MSLYDVVALLNVTGVPKVIVDPETFPTTAFPLAPSPLSL